MMTSRRRLLWLFTAAVTIAVVAWIYHAPTAGTGLRLRRRSPLVGVVPIVRPAGTLLHVPDLGVAGAYAPTDRIVSIEISEYAGYAGLIVANGGLQPSEDSLFFRDHNFRVRLSIREEESLTALNTGKLGGSATTADVVAVYGQNLNAVVPVLIGYSRGADGIVTRRAIDGFEGLKGKILATAQFTEAEFLIRYLANRIGVPVKLLASPDEEPEPGSVNLTFAQDSFDACDMLLTELVLNRTRLAGCSAWEPRTSATVQRSGGAAHFLMTTRNLLIVADVLLVNRGLAEQHPDMVAGLVDGILAGNQMVRNSPETTLTDVAQAFNWSRDKARDELVKVQLATMPENLEFFSGEVNEVGTFAHIYQSALDAYADLVAAPRPANQALDMRHLRGLQEAGKFPQRFAAIGRLRPLVKETDPLESLPAPEVVPQPHTLPSDAFGAGPR